MADFTPAQRAAMGALLAGTFDKLDTAPRMQPASSVSEIYKGIIPASGSSGGSAEASANALVSRKVQTMQVDGNGQPITGRTGSASLAPRGGSLATSAAVNAINTAVPHASGTIVNDKMAYRLPSEQPGLPDLYGNSQAQITVNGGMPQPVNVPLPRPRPANAPRGMNDNFLSGDPGQTDWSVANPGATGLFGVAAQGRMAQPNRYTPAPQRPLPVIPKQAVIAAQPQQVQAAPNVTDSINRFLSQSGQDTSNMTAGEQANALKKQMGLY